MTTAVTDVAARARALARLHRRSAAVRAVQTPTCMYALVSPRPPRWLRHLSWFIAGAVLAGLLGPRLRSSDRAAAPGAAQIAAERADAIRRFQAADCRRGVTPRDRSWFAGDPTRQPRVRALPAPERLRQGVAGVRRGLDLARCRPSLLSIAIGSTLIREGVDLAMTAVTDVAEVDRAAAAASLAASAGPMLQPQEIIRGEADLMLLEPGASAEAATILQRRDRALAVCSAGVALTRCASLLRAELPAYEVSFRRYLDARAAIVHLGTALRAPG